MAMKRHPLAAQLPLEYSYQWKEVALALHSVWLAVVLAGSHL
jgi:hypothetical protein